MSLRVLMATHWFDPEGGAAGHPGVIARAIRDLGHDVQVVTGFPTYPEGVVFDGYRNRPYLREVVDGITVHRGAIFPSHDSRALHRAANYLSYAASGSLTAVGASRRADVTFVYSSPATTAVPAMAVRALRRVPYLVHVQDLWPDSVTSSGFLADGPAGRVESGLHRFCDAVYRRAHTVAVSAPGMADILRRRGVPPDKLALLPNWADERHFTPRARSEALARRLGVVAPTVVMYAGNLGELQGLETVVDAAARLAHRTDVLFALVGSGVAEPRLREEVARRQLGNVRFVPAQPFDTIGDVLALADVQLVALKDVPVLRATLPSKLQANLAAGLPVIGVVGGDAADVIERSGAGSAVAPGDGAALARAVEDFAALDATARAAMGAAARSTYEREFSRGTIVARLDTLLHAAAGRG